MRDYSKENYIHSGWTLEMRRGHLYNTLLDENRDILKGTVLMIGCNSGTTLALLRDYAPQAIGMDINLDAIDIAKGSRVCGNCLQLPFLTKSVDTILALDIIEHIYSEDMPLLISEIHRVLKPAGFLYAFSPRCDKVKPSNAAMDPHHVQFFENHQEFMDPWWENFTGTSWNDTRGNPADGMPHDAVAMKICKL